MMDIEKFSAILPMIVAAVTDKIATEYHLDEKAAIEKVYSTQLYSYLEDEKTKVWHYSVDKIFDLYKMEIETGKLEIPGY